MLFVKLEIIKACLKRNNRMKRWRDEDREDLTLSNASLNYLIKNY